MSLYEKLKLNHKRVQINHIPMPIDGLVPSAQQGTIAAPIDVVIDTITQLEELTLIATTFLITYDIKKCMLYILYPRLKKKDANGTVLNRDTMMQKGESVGLKAISLIRVNDDYNCMGFKCAEVARANKAKRPSQCVNDYVDKVVLLKEKLSAYPAALQFYNTLAPGYQKEWARFIYSVVQLKTQQNRFADMCNALEKGCKSVEQYRLIKKNS